MTESNQQKPRQPENKVPQALSSKEVNSSAIESILLEAHRIVNNEKRTEYGPVEESFTRIASLWSIVLDLNITPRQVALCMIAFKLARELHKHKRDNLVDLSAYSHLLNELERIEKLQ